MLLKHRTPGIDAKSVQPRAGLEHLDRKSLAVLRWLNANNVDFVVVGPVAHAIRGDTTARGPVAIVPAPYSRNWDRLTRALITEHAGLRSDRGLPGSSERGDAVAVKLTPDKLARGRRWMLRFGEFDLDIEGSGTHAAGARTAGHGRAADEGTRAPRYQELLYEAHRFEVADGVSVEVGSPEDLEHFSHVRRTGTAPEFRVTRNGKTETAGPAADAPETGAEAPEAGADVAEAGAEAPVAGADAPKAGAEAPVAGADAPEATADAPDTAPDA